jgi:hypothetical protein
MDALRGKKLICYLSLGVSLGFAALWVRTYWYDTFLGYEARVTKEHLNHQYSIATSPGSFGFSVKVETLNPAFQRKDGVWSFFDSRIKPSFCGVHGTPQKSFLGFIFWTVGEANSYHYTYGWIPFWFPVTLFATPMLWLIIGNWKLHKPKAP